jgi:hypothetical protein
MFKHHRVSKRYLIVPLVILVLALNVVVSVGFTQDQEIILDKTFTLNYGEHHDFWVYLEEGELVTFSVKCVDYGIDPDMYVEGPGSYYKWAWDNVKPDCTASWASAMIKSTIPETGWYRVTVFEQYSSYNPGEVRLKVYKGYDPNAWNPFVMPETGGPEADVANSAGVTPCGVFDVQGWGDKITTLADFPDCSGPVTVMCLDDKGDWVANNISDFAQDGDVVTFMSGQHGTCGFFPTQ